MCLCVRACVCARLPEQATEATQAAEALRAQLEESSAKLERKVAKVRTLKLRLSDAEQLAEDVQNNANETIAKLRDEVRRGRSQVGQQQVPQNADAIREAAELGTKLKALNASNAKLVTDFRALQVCSVGGKVGREDGGGAVGGEHEEGIEEE